MLTKFAAALIATTMIVGPAIAAGITSTTPATATQPAKADTIKSSVKPVKATKKHATRHMKRHVKHIKHLKKLVKKSKRPAIHATAPVPTKPANPVR